VSQLQTDKEKVITSKRFMNWFQPILKLFWLL